MIKFTQEQLDFLNVYKPKDDFFTSNEEIKTIVGMFEMYLKGNEEIVELRNSIVKFYDGLMTDKEAVYRYMGSLQSITAVIDYMKVNRGLEV